MKKLPITLLIFISITAYASNLKGNGQVLAIFNQDMKQLEQVSSDENIYISTVSTHFDDITDETRYMHEFKGIDRVNNKDAIEMKLIKARSYYIYSINSLQGLTCALSQRLTHNQPDYFSATLLQGNRHDHGTSEYIAKITEYKHPLAP